MPSLAVTPVSTPSSGPARAPDPLIGRVLGGRYSLDERLGSGSMGTVYRGTQLAVSRQVAVKILRSERTLDASAKARFLREARANSLLASPHTVRMLDFGETEAEGFFLVMELLEGESLRQRLARLGRLAPDSAVEACQQALRSLNEAHKKGVVHRDLKPDHLFFSRVKGETWDDEVLKVLDFGVAKMLGDDAEGFNALETRDGRILGTPRYMSPEQAQGRPLDARSDLYSLGVILYEMLTGRPPFPSEDGVLVMADHVTSCPEPPSVASPEAGIPPELDRFVMRLLAKDPRCRPASAAAMAAELGKVAPAVGVGVSGVRPIHVLASASIDPDAATVDLGRPLRKRRAVLAVGAAVLLAMTAGAVLLLGASRSSASTTPKDAVFANVRDDTARDPAPSAPGIPVEALPLAASPATPKHASARAPLEARPSPRPLKRPRSPASSGFDYLE